MSFEIRKVIRASLLGIGFFSIWILLLLPSQWIYDRLAIRAAFGRESGSLPQVTVKSIKKPSTVTFSSGVVADVGYTPAAVSSGFHIVVFLIGGGFYLYKFRRQFRAFSDEFRDIK